MTLTIHVDAESRPDGEWPDAVALVDSRTGERRVFGVVDTEADSS